MLGQDAFGAIQEIARILSADPRTDWYKVDGEALRWHLADMNEVILNARAKLLRGFRRGTHPGSDPPDGPRPRPRDRRHGWLDSPRGPVGNRRGPDRDRRRSRAGRENPRTRLHCPGQPSSASPRDGVPGGLPTRRQRSNIYDNLRVRARQRGKESVRAQACLSGGRGGIRTHGTLAGTPHFECGAFNHSTTRPTQQPHPPFGGEAARKLAYGAAVRKAIFQVRIVISSAWTIVSRHGFVGCSSLMIFRQPVPARQAPHAFDTVLHQGVPVVLDELDGGIVIEFLRRAFHAEIGRPDGTQQHG